MLLSCVVEGTNKWYGVGGECGHGSGWVKVHILIADHELSFRGFLRRTLSRDAMVEVVAEATGGLEASEMAELVKPDVVIIDMDMPRGDGVEAIRRIRSRLPGTRLISLSSAGDEAHRRAAMANGADAFFPKGAAVLKIASWLRGAP